LHAVSAELEIRPYDEMARRALYEALDYTPLPGVRCLRLLD
jgi:hypothetical protein